MGIHQEPNLLQRLVGGAVVLAFACVPLYIGGVLLIQIFAGQEPVNVDIFITIAITIIIAFPFLVLAYRIFTGKGRKEDGGLVSPYVLLVLSIIFGGVGVLIILVIPDDDIFKLLYGSIPFIAGGIGGIILSVKRIKS